MNVIKHYKNDFQKKVFNVIRRIPRGRVLTYKEVARRAGRPAAYRVVGNILSKNYNPKIPCHRVIRSDGKLGGYNRGIKTKRFLLQREGVKTAVYKVRAGRRVLRKGFPDYYYYIAYAI